MNRGEYDEATIARAARILCEKLGHEPHKPMYPSGPTWVNWQAEKIARAVRDFSRVEAALQAAKEKT